MYLIVFCGILRYVEVFCGILWQGPLRRQCSAALCRPASLLLLLLLPALHRDARRSANGPSKSDSPRVVDSMVQQHFMVFCGILVVFW